jgi:hypothetical protein
MAEAPYIVVLGSSNVAGFLALLDDVPSDDMTRWVGAASVQPPIPSTSAQRPYELRIPGIRLLTPVRPHSTTVTRPIAGAAGGRGTLDYGGEVVDAFVDSWIYIRTSTSGQGKMRRIVAESADPVLANWLFYRSALLGGEGGAHRLFIDESFCRPTSLANWPFYRDALLGGGAGRDLLTGSTELDASLSQSLSKDEFGSWGTVVFLQDSYTIGSINPARTTITRSATAAPLFTSAVNGRDVVFFADNSVRRIVAWTIDSITVDKPVVLGLAGGFCILTGAGACETIADLADPTKCVLQDETIFLDQNAPVFLTGRDVCNYDATPFQNPRVAYAAGPTVNSILELGFLQRTELTQPLVVVEMGISASMLSPFLQGAIYSPDPVPPFAGFIGWFQTVLSLDFSPTSPSALFAAATNEITAAELLIKAEGNTPKCVGIYINLFDNDEADAQRLKRIGANAEVLVEALWEHIGETVATVLTGPSRYGGTAANRELIYAQLKALEAANKAIGVSEMRMGTEIAGGVYVFPDDYAIDGLHFSAGGQIKKARVDFDTWIRVRERLAAPEPAAATPTDAEIVAGCRTALLAGTSVVSFPGNGGQITLPSLQAVRELMESTIARMPVSQGGRVRKTLARFP